MKKNIFLIMLGFLFMISMFPINNIKIRHTNKVNSEPVIEIPQKPTEPYGFNYLDDWQKNLYNLLASDTLKIGDEYTFDETKDLEYVKMVIDLYYQNNPTRPSPKTYIPVENSKLVTDPNDPSFKYSIGVGTTNKINISLWAYSDIDEELKKYNAIDKKADEIIATFPENASDYEKLKIIFDYLVENVEYDYYIGSKIENNNINETEIEQAENASSTYGALINKKAICSGFAQAFQYLSNKANLHSLYVVTIINEYITHAYNIVWLDGNYYRIDATWNLFLKSNPFKGDYIKGIKLPDVMNNYIKK